MNPGWNISKTTIHFHNTTTLITHFWEERIEAVDFLLFLHKSIILWDAFERQLVHQIDLVRVVQMFSLKQTTLDAE